MIKPDCEKLYVLTDLYLVMCVISKQCLQVSYKNGRVLRIATTVLFLLNITPFYLLLIWIDYSISRAIFATWLLFQPVSWLRFRSIVFQSIFVKCFTSFLVLNHISFTFSVIWQFSSSLVVVIMLIIVRMLPNALYLSRSFTTSLISSFWLLCPVCGFRSKVLS